MLTDRLPERLPLLGIANRFFKCGLRHPNSTGGDVNPAYFQTIHHLLEALTLFPPNQTGCWSMEILERDFAGIEPFVAKLFDVAADVESRCTLLGGKQTNAFVAWLSGRVGFGSNAED